MVAGCWCILPLYVGAWPFAFENPEYTLHNTCRRHIEGYRRSTSQPKLNNRVEEFRCKPPVQFGIFLLELYAAICGLRQCII
jgi:hypothetical protein